MKKFERDYNISEYKGKAYTHYFGGLKPCVFDIEATGLSPRNSKLVMTALLIPNENGVKITQFLAENHYEEDRVLIATMEFLKEQEIDYLITYNGIRYDVPFVNTRLEALNLPYHLDLYDFDMYRFLRKYSNLPRYLDSLSQSSVERYFGIRKDREDTISGKEHVALFNEYALTGNTQIEKVMLTHNREDVLQLYKLLHAAGRDEWSHILEDIPFDYAIGAYGLPVCKGRFSARPSINKQLNGITITGVQNYYPINAEYFNLGDTPITGSFTSVTKSFDIYIPLEIYNGSAYINVKALGNSEAFQELDNYISDCLIIYEKGKPKYSIYRNINDLSERVIKMMIEI